MSRKRNKQKRAFRAACEMHLEQLEQDHHVPVVFCDNEPKSLSKAFEQINPQKSPLNENVTNRVLR
jgi:hypothetical protein